MTSSDSNGYESEYLAVLAQCTSIEARRRSRERWIANWLSEKCAQATRIAGADPEDLDLAKLGEWRSRYVDVRADVSAERIAYLNIVQEALSRRQEANEAARVEYELGCDSADAAMKETEAGLREQLLLDESRAALERDRRLIDAKQERTRRLAAAKTSYENTSAQIRARHARERWLSQWIVFAVYMAYAFMILVLFLFTVNSLLQIGHRFDGSSLTGRIALILLIVSVIVVAIGLVFLWHVVYTLSPLVRTSVQRLWGPVQWAHARQDRAEKTYEREQRVAEQANSSSQGRIESDYNSTVAHANREYESLVSNFEVRHSEQSEALNYSHQAEQEDLQRHLDDARSDADEEYENEVTSACAFFTDAIERIADQLRQETADAYAARRDCVLYRLQTADRNAPLSVASYEGPVWSRFGVTTEMSAAPFHIRVGSAIVHGNHESIEIPVAVPFFNERHLLLETPQIDEASVSALRSILYRLLAGLPAGRAQFTLIDAIGLGDNVDAFMRLARYDEQLVNGRAWFERSDIDRQMRLLTEHMGTVIQKYLVNDFQTMAEYNSQSAVIEPSRVLVVIGFPASFSDEAVRRLVSILERGVRCGIYAVILLDTGRPLPGGVEHADLERHATVISVGSGTACLGEEPWRKYPLKLDHLPATSIINPIIDAIGAAGARKAIPADTALPPSPDA